MGKNKRDYREEVESYGYASDQSSDDSEDSSASSSSQSTSSSISGGDSDRDRRKRHIKMKSCRFRREKRAKKSSDEEVEEEVSGEHEDRRKKTRHAEEYPEERRYHSSSGSSGRKKKHHHHRKHKHKHRHHRRHHSEERSRGCASLERTEAKKGREIEERRGKERLEMEVERKVPKEIERRDRREKKHREKGKSDSRQVRSKWDDEDDSYNANKRIKTEPGLEESEDEEDRRGAGRRRRQQQQEQQRPERRPQHRDEEARVRTELGTREHRDLSGNKPKEENGRTGWGPGREGAREQQEEPETMEERQKPNMGLTGKLTEDSNTYNGVVIKYSQPPEARKPKRRWRWYIFKGDEELPFLPLHRQSAYLIGRDRKVADIPTDHPSCSKQHAVLQYRLVTYNREDGTKGRTVKPYILDLDSANGTFINNRKIETKRFVELLEKDVVKFGYSSREYILLHEGSKGDEDSLPDAGVELSPVSLLRS